MTDFKIGDRVFFTRHYTVGIIPTGYQDTGTIVEDRRGPSAANCQSRDRSYAVRLHRENPEIHSCDGATDMYHGYYCDERDLKLISEMHFSEQKAKPRTNILRSLLMATRETKDSTQDETKI